MAKNEIKTNQTPKKNNKNSEVKQTGSMLFALNLVLAIVTMILVILLTSGIMNKDTYLTASFLGASIIAQLVVQLLFLFIYKKAKDKIRIIIISLLYIAAIVLAFMAVNNYVLFYVANALIAGAEALNQFLLIEKEKTKKGAITNILLAVALAALCVGIFLNITEENKYYIFFVTAILFLFDVLRKI